MRTLVPTLVGTLLVATAGFAAASIASGGNPTAALTGSTGSPETAPSERRVALCHRTGSKKRPFVTMTVSRNAVAAHLRHGDKPGPCPSNESASNTSASASKAKAKKKAKESAATTTTTTAETPSTGGKEHGNGGGHGRGGKGKGK
jgi:hypothetical protein